MYGRTRPHTSQHLRTRSLYTSGQERSALAILHIVLWLIHAVVQALATALVDVFTSMTTALILLFVVVLAGAGLASAFGLGGIGILRRRRRRE